MIIIIIIHSNICFPCFVSEQSDGSFGGAVFQKVRENVRISRTGNRERVVTSFRSNDTQNLQEKGLLHRQYKMVVFEERIFSARKI